MPTPPASLIFLALVAPATAQDAPVPAKAAEKAAPAPGGPESARPARQVAGPAAAYKTFNDLTGRYRFIEQYARPDDEARKPWAIGQYRVLIRETLRDELEAGPKAAKPAEVVRETTFDERPAEVSSLVGVGASVRRYVGYRVTPDTDEAGKSDGLRPLEGLTLSFRPKPNEPPQVVCLAANRRLFDREYDLVSRQVFVPGLTWILPTYPVRVGDTWRIPRRAAQAMLGEPELRGDSLGGRLVELSRSDEGRTSHAVFGISGRVANQYADTIVNAQVVFTFPTPGPDRPNPDRPAAKPKDAPVVEARGLIVEMRLAVRAEGTMPGPDGQPRKFQANQELVVERKPGVHPGSAPINISPLPPATEVNSWLLHADPKGRFRFYHPQDLLPPGRLQLAGPSAADSVLLVNGRRPEGRDLVSVAYFPAEQTPESLKDLLNDQWKKTPAEILPGEEGWLPEADWPGMKVFHLEAALKAPGRGTRSPRLHYNAYLVKPAPGGSFLVIATTTREAVATYRQEVEQMIRSIRVGQKPSS